MNKELVVFNGIKLLKKEILRKFPTSKLANFIKRKPECDYFDIRFPFEICPLPTGKKYLEQISCFLFHGTFACFTEDVYDDRHITKDELYEALKFLGIEIEKEDIHFVCHHIDSYLYDSGDEDDEVLDAIFN
jgi:hypothetical protein